VTLDELNALSSDAAMDTFRSCCGASRWVRRMVAGMPYASRDAVLTTADTVWSTLGPDAWREAFGHHPRIGDRTRATGQGTQAEKWSADEQRDVSAADASVRAQLDVVNREYEARFGFIYIVCASGRSAAELLALAHDRLQNDLDTELRIAAEEQRRITRLRLEKLLSTTP
jgi:2-oxo-4-hydroxy-4-carboxy-5-ureidoimidazoline decarboxylase